MSSISFILYFAWANQRDRVCFIFHKVQGCMLYGKRHSYEVNLFIVFAPQHIPEGDNCIFAYQHYTVYVKTFERENFRGFRGF